MEENTAIDDNRMNVSVPAGSVIFKSVIVLFFCYALASYLFVYLFEAMLNMLKSTDFFLNHKITINLNTLKVQFSIIMGLLFALPFVSIYFLSYKSPEIYTSRKRRFMFLAAAPSILSITGVVVLVFVLFPAILDMSPNYAIVFPNFDYISSIFPLIIGIGLFVDLPVVTYILNKTGIFPKMKPLISLRYLVIFALIIGALVTPPDPISMLFMAVIFIILYEISAFTTRIM